MMERKLKDIAGMLEETVTEGPSEEIAVRGVSTDSRSIQAGQLFVPLVGPHFDGHRFVTDAVQKGAAAVLWGRAAGVPPAHVPTLVVDDTLAALQKLAAAYLRQTAARVIAVTGSNGKTTTKDLIASVLSTTYKVWKTEGNLNNHIGLPLTILNMRDDTEMVVLEMGMSGRGEIARLSQIARPEVAVITNVGEAHLLQLGTREEIARAKLEILQGMQADGLFLYPGDEPLLAALIEDENRFEQELGFPRPPQWKTIRFGASAESEFYPIAIMQDKAVTRFHLNSLEQTTFTLPLSGRHNVHNAISAICIGQYMGVLLGQIEAGLKRARVSGMRAEWIESGHGFTILNDAYNSSPTAMKAALEWVGEMRGFRRKMLIVGDMLELGERENEYHAEVGRMIDPDQIDYVLTYGERAALIASQARRRFPSGTVYASKRKSEVAAWARDRLQAGDLVLVKGSRGMKMEEIVNLLS